MLVLALLGAGPWGAVAHAKAPIVVGEVQLPASVAPYDAINNTFLDNFRRIGTGVNYAQLATNLPPLEALAATGSDAQRAAALIQIGRIQSSTHHYDRAAEAFRKAVQISAASGRMDLSFEADMRLINALYEQDDYGAEADKALDDAIAAAGPQPTQHQRFRIADAASSVATGRGELESGLVLGLAALQHAQGPADRAYALRDVADALRNLVSNCLFYPLRDARSSRDPPTAVAPACDRAQDAAVAAYQSAAKVDHAQGWAFIEGIDNTQVEVVLMLSSTTGLVQNTDAQVFKPGMFTPRDSAHVLVQRGEKARQFLRKTVMQTIGGPQFGRAVIDALAQLKELTPPDLDTLMNAAQAQEARTGRPGAATAALDKAARLLLITRSSFFDARRQGTALAKEQWVFQQLALRHLATDEDEEAFAMLEGTRARGLEDLTDFLRRGGASAQDRAWLARQAELDAEVGAMEERIAANFIAKAAAPVPPPELAQWEPLWRQQRQHLLERADLRERLRRAKAPDITLADLRKASTQAGVPVLMYWGDSTYVYGWYVGPHGSAMRMIFLPSIILQQKLNQLKRVADPTASFDEETARQLYLFVIAPFADLLDARQLIIVPEGELVDLPFEMLVDPEGRFLIQQKAVSYAASARMAYDALTRPIPRIRAVKAVIDPSIDDGTHEVRALRATGLKLHVVRTTDATPQLLLKSLSGAQSVHLLLHGAFRADAPLLSSLATTLQTSPPVTAAELLAIPMPRTQLVVMSACESGELTHNLSNEIYGLPWAVLGAGAQNVVTSRWLVNGASNSQWMGQFYQALAAGASPANAAATAMRVMLKRERNPYY